MHPRVLRELAHVIARPLWIIFERSWRLTGFLRSGRKLLSLLPSRRARRRIQRTAGWSVPLRSLGR